jgi:hypothetical protein
MLAQAVELVAEVVQLDAGRRDQLVQLLADLLRLARAVADGLHVIAVLRLLLAGAAALHPDDEDDCEEDRACNQDPEPEERRLSTARRRAGREPGASLRAGALTLGGLDGRRLVEEVEFDISRLGVGALALEHDRERGAKVGRVYHRPRR